MQCNVNRATNNGNQQEIEEAEELLDEAIMDKKESNQWSHPEETIEKLKEILEYQTQNKQEPQVIEQTQGFLEEAEEALKLIQQDQEDTFYFQLVETNETMEEFNRRNNSVIEELSEPQQIPDNLPPIQHQSFCEEQQDAGAIFSQEISHYENIEKELQSNSDQSNMSIDDGQKTPIAGTNTNTINIIQNQINEALKKLSPREKLEKMRRQAKLNATTRQSKLNQLIKSKKESVFVITETWLLTKPTRLEYPCVHSEPCKSQGVLVTANPAHYILQQISP